MANQQERAWIQVLGSDHEARAAGAMCAATRRSVWLGYTGDIQSYLNRSDADSTIDVWITLLRESPRLRRSVWLDIMLKFRARVDAARFHTQLNANADLFVALLVKKQLKMLALIDARLLPAALPVIDVDLSRMMEIACADGDSSAVEWLCDPATLRRFDSGDCASQLQIGLSKAFPRVIDERGDALLALLLGKSIITQSMADDLLLVKGSTHHLESLKTATPACSEETKPIAEAATASVRACDVLLDAELMRFIGTFLEDPLATVRRFKKSSHIAAFYVNDRFLPYIAIIEDNLQALQALFELKRHADARQQYEFQDAMHIAACEGRLEMLQWLHKQPGDSHRCRVDTMAAAVRGGWADVVEWLHLHCPKSALTMSEHAINDAVRSGHVEVLKVCARYGLGKFTVRTMAIAEEEDNVDVIQVVAQSILKAN